MNRKLVVVRHSGLRTVTSDEVATGLPTTLVRIVVDREIDTARFALQVEQGDWVGQGAWLAAEAGYVLAAFREKAADEIHYFGLAEIPHAIAMGALLGDEHPIEIHEYDRDAKSWIWPADAEKIKVEVEGLPDGSPVKASGTVVLRVEVSFPISDEDVRAAVGDLHLAHVRVRLALSEAAQICKVRCPADLSAVREAVRAALATLREKTPNFEVLHLFVAAPMSVCFAVGQELKPRNSPPVQTYRYRKVPGEPAYKPGIELSARLESEADEPLTAADAAKAREVRIVWSRALREVEIYAAQKREGHQPSTATWFGTLSSAKHLQDVRPFPPLPRITEVVPTDVTVDEEPVPREFGFTKKDAKWHLSDRLLVGFYRAAGGCTDKLEQLIKLFLFHEYVHEAHSLTKLRAPGVGIFANCLEFIDYTADCYSLLHVLDYERERNFSALESDKSQLELLRNLVALLIDAFWAFEPKPPLREMQARRLGRYLNWYWRHAQLEQCESLGIALRLLSSAPHVEIGGLIQVARDRRVFCKLALPPASRHIELGLVMENCRLLRIADSTTFNLIELVSAFENKDSASIMSFFRGVFEEAAITNGALPA
jgi:hypothetical protein